MNVLFMKGLPRSTCQSLALTIIRMLKANKRCLYLNSPTMVVGMHTCLAAEGLNVSEEIDRGALILTSDQSHLVNGKFDVNRMMDRLRSAVQRALVDGYDALWATGDMAWEFGNESNLIKLFEYEHQLETFMQSNKSLCGVCQYHRDSLPPYAIKPALRCHQSIYINETLSRLNPEYDLRAYG